MPKHRLLPFHLLPAAWGLRGASRARAEAEYYLEGETLDRALAEIDYPEGTERQRRLLEIDRHYGRIEPYEYARRVVDLQMPDGIDKEVALLGVEKEHGNISQEEYDKQLATLRDEPYIGVLASTYDPKLNVNGLYFELDWNEQFIKMLQQHGYSGVADENVVNRWFDDVCRSVAESEGFAEPDEIVTAMFPSAHTRRVRRDDGKTEHS